MHRSRPDRECGRGPRTNGPGCQSPPWPGCTQTQQKFAHPIASTRDRRCPGYSGRRSALASLRVAPGDEFLRSLEPPAQSNASATVGLNPFADALEVHKPARSPVSRTTSFKARANLNVFAKAKAASFRRLRSGGSKARFLCSWSRLRSSQISAHLLHAKFACELASADSSGKSTAARCSERSESSRATLLKRLYRGGAACQCVQGVCGRFWRCRFAASW